MTCIAPPATFRARAIAARTVTLNLDPAGRALLGGDYAAAVQHLEAALDAAHLLAAAETADVRAEKALGEA